MDSIQPIGPILYGPTSILHRPSVVQTADSDTLKGKSALANPQVVQSNRGDQPYGPSKVMVDLARQMVCKVMDRLR